MKSFFPVTVQPSPPKEPPPTEPWDPPRSESSRMSSWAQAEADISAANRVANAHRFHLMIRSSWFRICGQTLSPAVVHGNFRNRPRSPRPRAPRLWRGSPDDLLLRDFDFDVVENDPGARRHVRLGGA